MGKLALEHLVQGYGGVFHIRTYGTTHVGRWPFSVPISPAPKKILLGAGVVGQVNHGSNPIIQINKA